MSATVRDENKVAGLIAKSDADNTVVVVEADPSTKRLKVNATLNAGSAAIGVVDTELPAAAALSDTTGNPTTPMIGAAGMVWDGTQWVRIKQAVAATNTTGTGVPMLAPLYQYDDTSTATVTENQFAPPRIDSNRFPYQTLGTLISGEDQTNNLQAITHKPVASSVYTGTAFSAVLNDVDISVKATPGNLLSIEVSSINAAIRYLQLHNKATAPAGGDTPVFSTPIPAGSATVPAIKELGRDFFGEHGHYFSTGISIGISTVAATFTAATTTDHVTNGTFV